MLGKDSGMRGYSRNPRDIMNPKQVTIWRMMKNPKMSQLSGDPNIWATKGVFILAHTGWMMRI